MCVLALLSKGEKYGYEISRTLESIDEGVLKVKEGTLYPLLRRLESKGYVVATWRITEGKARRYYKITEQGYAFLRSIKDFWNKIILAVDEIFGGDSR